MMQSEHQMQQVPQLIRDWCFQIYHQCWTAQRTTLIAKFRSCATSNCHSLFICDTARDNVTMSADRFVCA